MQALLDVNLRFGKMQIFHRYASLSGTNVVDDEREILFSVTSMLHPGSFDLNKIGDFSCPGLVFFSQLNKLKDTLFAFNVLLETAHELLGALGGVLCDENRLPLTDKRVQCWYDRLRALEMSRATGDLFHAVDRSDEWS